MDWFDYLLLPMNLFLFFPPLAFLPAIGLFAVYRKKRALSAAIAAGLWAAYGAYESYMSWVWSPKAIAPTRPAQFTKKAPSTQACVKTNPSIRRRKSKDNSPP